MSLARLVRLASIVALLATGCEEEVTVTPTCTDGIKNGSETDVDCGGAICGACDDGKSCMISTDCKIKTCLNGTCKALPATCSDGVKNGSESDVDCGGKECLPCDNGRSCAGPADCRTQICVGGKCAGSACDDKVKNGDETDVDCGGATCPKCDLSKACLRGGDCKSASCVNNVCSPTCTDGAKDGAETDVDCGGPNCAPCDDGKACNAAKDCKNGLCLGNTCASPTCVDKRKDNDETDIDCGGKTCPKCEIGQSCIAGTDCKTASCVNNICTATCTDGIKDQDETDVDCGGKACGPCADGAACNNGSDCKSRICAGNACVPSACMNQAMDGQETDIDCGGPDCSKCDLGQKCLAARDCKSASCLNNVCSANCGDGVKNGNETDIDCGGSCPACMNGKGCGGPADCASRVCMNGACVAATCMDKVKNGNESDVDCGGPDCPACPDKGGCSQNKDCASFLCVNGACQPPSCMDGVKNGNETDIDCGGSCPVCGTAKTCAKNADCWNNTCTNMKCGGNGSVAVGGQGNPALDPNGDGSKLVVLDGNGNVTVDRATSLLNIARFVWVSNSGEGTVSKIDPSGGPAFKEVARYCTAPGCNADPSRASVSLDGNAGIANRESYYYSGNPKGGQNVALASAVMIAGNIANCVDRNGNGKIDTNLSGGTIALNSPFYWPSNTQISPDECVLWWTTLNKDRNGNFIAGGGSLPRSATFDSKPSGDGSLLSSNFYVGLFGSSELVQIDAKTGAIKQQVAVPGQPYSSVFDRLGNLWIRDGASSNVIKVDTSKPNLPSAVFGPPAPCSYAITADRRGYIYSSGGTCITRMDPSAQTPSWETLALPNACFPRGPSLDANYNLWVPDTCYGAYRVDASKPFGQGMTLVKQIPLQGDNGQYILGSAIDGNAIPFFVNTENSGTNANCCGPYNASAVGSVYRIDPITYAVNKIKVGVQPYVYSDLSGSQLALTSPTTGSYRKTFQPFCGAKATWTSMTWTDTVPQGTTLQVYYRAAGDPISLQTAPFVSVGTEPPAIAQPVTISLPQGTNPAYFQVQFTISTSDTQNKPTLGSVTVNYTCP